MNQNYYNILLDLTKKATKKSEVPVSAIIVKDDKIIARAYNKKNKSKYIGDHAEMIVIKKASKKLKNWHLDNCDLYVTLKPCKMCESAINQSRIKNVYYILDKPIEKKEYYKTNYIKENNSTQENELSSILRTFFIKKRDKKK